MKLSKEEIRQIIEDEIEIDCYSEGEANMGWAIYMEEQLNYPFEADYMLKNISGEVTLKRVIVRGNVTNESNFTGGEYYVEVKLDEMLIKESIDELANIKADEQTLEALSVWKHRNEVRCKANFE